MWRYSEILTAFTYCVIEDAAKKQTKQHLLSPHSSPQTVKFVFFLILLLSVLSTNGGWKASVDSVGFSVTWQAREVVWGFLVAIKG